MAKVKVDGKAQDQIFRLLCWGEEWGFKEGLEVLDQLLEIPAGKTNKDGRNRAFYAEKWVKWVKSEAMRKEMEKKIKESLK